MTTPKRDPSDAPCAFCGRPEGHHTETNEAIAELRLRSIRPKKAAARAVELAALRFAVSEVDLKTATRRKLAPFPEARRAVVCMLRRAGMPIGDIAKDLGWDRSALHRKERESAVARAEWDAAREREAGERLARLAEPLGPEWDCEDEGTILSPDERRALSPDELRALRAHFRAEAGERLFVELAEGGVLAIGGPAEVEDGWRDEAGRLVVLLRDGTHTLRGRLVLPEAFGLAELVRQCAPEQMGAPEQHSPAVPVVQDHAEPAGRFSAEGAGEAAARQEGEGPLWSGLAPVAGGDAETLPAEAAADEGKQLPSDGAPPPHVPASSKEDRGVGVLLVGHEGLEPPSAQVAQEQPIGEGAENRGSTKAVAAGAENLNTGTEGGGSRREERGTGAGVQVTRDQDALVQDCTRVGVLVGRLLREAEERGARLVAPLKEELGEAILAASELGEALDAERAELARVRQAWAAAGAELDAERERGRRLMEAMRRARDNLTKGQIEAASRDLRTLGIVGGEL